MRGSGTSRSARAPARRLEAPLGRRRSAARSRPAAHARVEVLEARHDARDALADAVVVRDELLPRHAARRRRASRARGPPRSRARSRSAGRRGREPALRAVHRAIESSTVTNCAPAALTSRSVRPRQGSSSTSRAEQVRAVQLRRDVDGERRARERGLGERRVGRRHREVAAERRRRRAPVPSRHRLDRLDRVEAGLARRREAELAPSASRNAGRGRSQMPIVRSPWTLLWPRTGHGPAPGLPMFPRSSSRFITSCTLPTPKRCCVRPIAQQAIVRSARRVELGELAHLGARDAALAPERVEGVRVERLREALEAAWCARARKAWSSTAPGARPRARAAPSSRP